MESQVIFKKIDFDHEDVSMDEIIRAAKDARVHDFIKNLPDGYDSVIGHRGVQISGGQAQRIAIARAFIQDAKIVLLDEATSALDKESETLIQEALARLMENRTVIVVTHNTDFLRSGDWVIEMKAGKVVSQATYEKYILI